jgi:hypothetical protein
MSRETITGWFRRARSSAKQRWQRFKDWISKPGFWPVVARWVFAILLFGLAVAFLVFLNFLLRGAGLWGDLAFAILVTTAVFWIARRLASPWLVEGPLRSFFRAFSTTIFVLVGVPVAYVTRWWGVVFLLLPIGIWALFRIVDAIWHRPRRKPVFWQAEAAGVLLLGIVLLVAPSVGSVERVPQAVPAAEAADDHDTAVAEAFRPLLFFDSGEQRFPLDIDHAIEDGRVEMCRKQVRTDACQRVESPGSIDENLDYLELAEDPGTPRGGGDRSAIYYHVVRDEGDGRVYVDYWWFYTRNPSPVAGKVFCGPGLRTPPFTCQEHSGDWEGLTAVLAPCAEGDDDCEDVEGELLGPEEIRYGQHENVMAYDWGDLKTVWASLAAPGSEALAEIWNGLVIPEVRDAGAHAVAFAARNSHASYPTPCFRNCEQQGRDLPEGRHDGAVPWSRNADCAGCVLALPLTREGEPALWNAFPGRWGEQRCILAGAYCDLSGAPRSPSFQERYEDPAGDVTDVCLRETDAGALRFAVCD